MPDRSDFTENIIRVIRSVPAGKVITYGAVAAKAGNPRGARGVAWILNSSAKTEALPWHRVINSRGTISLKPGYGFELQKQLLESEGVDVSGQGAVDLHRYFWNPECV